MNYPVINPVETGRRINRLRKSKGLSVPYLRDYFGFSTTNAIYKWLRGDTLPSLDNMFALSLLLGESVNDILVLSAVMKGRLVEKREKRKECVCSSDGRATGF